ncbi:Transient receptor potential cation channel subfamily A member 1 [Paramuricea clavata]|uniref:Transient receptor potential cation channel subfamily A member 1 n=1 Tax=Paramuricea clavata TaxID=317549 RepID=A0A7D9KA95_PARCT|nr:Transient receptor potential cation channel subfamily A member 1 [Paramuricea clavata]
MKGKLHDCKELLTEVGLPKHKSRLVDFTDTGPGLGITNHEVKIRSVEEIRIMNYDYYICHHLAPGDSSHNEIERIQSYVGDAVCDDGSLTWEHKTKSDVLSNLDVSNITTSQFEELELERMKFNAFKVAEEVAERIDCGVAPDGYMKSFASKDADKLFYWDKCYLLGFTERKNNEVVPGYNYYSKLEAFSKR